MHLKTHFTNYRLLFFLTWICLVGVNHGMAQTSDYSTLFSEELNESRIIQVDLPDCYATSKKEYPVLFVLDGEYIFDYAKGVTSFLSNDFGFLPETIVIGIPNTDRNRDLFVDLSPNGSYLKFIAFLEQELIPFVDQNYRTNHFRTLLGWSSGSGIANYIGVKKPQLFNAYILAGAGIGPKTEVFIQKEMDPGSYIQNFLFVSTEGTMVRAEGLKKHQSLVE
nr:alpha/beta hydrolase-fold protein [uncultured Allomuricauda sp.]